MAMRIKIGMTAWRRPEYFSQVIERLHACWEIADFECFVSVDGGYPEAQTRQQEIFAASGLRGEIVLQPENLGCCRNTGLVFNSLFTDGADAVIMLEDDTVPSVDFLRYMRTMLTRFESDENVFNVSGFHRRLRADSPALSPQSVVLEQRPAAGGRVTVTLGVPTTKRPTQVRTGIGPGKVDGIFLRRRMELNGWGTWRRIHEEIGDNWFCIKGEWGVAELADGETFLQHVTIDPRGCWDWPLKKYWRRGRAEVAPDLSRIQNIGAEGGTWIQDPAFHYRYHHTDFWLDGTEGYRGEFELLPRATGVQKVY